MTTSCVTEKEVIDALPPPGSFLHDYVQYAAWCTDAPAAYHIAGGLSILSQTVPVDYHCLFGTPMNGNIYAVCVGPSGDRKSGAVGVARKLLEKAIHNSVGTPPGSVENLVDSLAKTPRQLVVYSEFGSFLSKVQTGYLNPLKTAYTEAWDGTPLGRGLVKSTNEAKNPRLSLLCGVTPDFLARHTEPADWTGGFMARFICFACERERDYSVPPGYPGREAELVERVKQLEGAGQFGVPRGQCRNWVFTPRARARWDEWYHQLKVYRKESTEETAAAVSRSHAQALRIALLLTWDFGQARSGYDWEIDLEQLEPAIAITKLHLKSVLHLGQSLDSSKDMRDRRVVLKTFPLRVDPTTGVGTPEPISLGTILKQSRVGMLRRVREILETLVEEGTIKQYSHIDTAGAWYILTTEAEQAMHGRAKGVTFPVAEQLQQSAQVVALGEEVSQGAVVIPIAPYLQPAPLHSIESGTVNTPSAPAVEVEVPAGAVVTFDS